jgi:hypothetical protein
MKPLVGVRYFVFLIFRIQTFTKLGKEFKYTLFRGFHRKIIITYFTKTKNNLMKAYKVFDQNWKCRDFQYEVGKTYRLENAGELIEPKMCERGFRACKKVNHCFSYYNFDVKNKIAEVELEGTILGLEEDKQCSNIITILKEVSWLEMLSLANLGLGCSGHSNSGHSNSGHWNSGHSNSGHWNSGHRNSGHRNSGDWNSGHWNSGDWNSGFFNSATPSKILVFGKMCDRSKWNNAEKPSFIFFKLTEWVCFSSMTDQEKIDQPKAYVCDGYLKTKDYRQAWKEAFESASESDISLLKALPNFNAKVFKEISGIEIA